MANNDEYMKVGTTGDDGPQFRGFAADLMKMCPPSDPLVMDWSLGVTIDMIWRHYPPARPSIRDQIVEYFDMAITIEDENLMSPNPFRIANEVLYKERLEPMLLDVSAHEDDLRVLLDFLHFAWTYEHRYSRIVHDHLSAAVFEKIDLHDWDGTIRRLHPKLWSAIPRADRDA